MIFRATIFPSLLSASRVVFVFLSCVACATRTPWRAFFRLSRSTAYVTASFYLGGSRGPRFLLRSDAGDLVGLYPRGAEPFSLYAAPLAPAAKAADSLGRVGFFEDGGKLTVRS
jgi:hypothetical protein